MKFQVEKAGPEDPILEFLNSIDPGLLERDALNSLGWGDESVGVAILKKLKEYASGSSRQTPGG